MGLDFGLITPLLGSFADQPPEKPVSVRRSQEICLGEAILCVDSMRLLPHWMGTAGTWVRLGRYRDQPRSEFPASAGNRAELGQAELGMGVRGRRSGWGRLIGARAAPLPARPLRL